MTTETILWPAARVRVIPARQFENPWFRQGQQAREQRAFLQDLAPLADRQEEDEDYDTWAPVRPTRRYTEPEEHFLSFDPGEIGPDSEQKAWDEYEREMQRKAERDNDKQRIAERRRWMKQPWHFTTEDWALFDQAEQLERLILRRDGHWFGGRDWFELGGRLLRTHIVAWYLQHGEIDSALVLTRTCNQQTCISPHHHKESS